MFIMLSGGMSGKEPVHQCRKLKRLGFNPWVRKIPWRGAWQPTPVFLPGESLGQRSLTGYDSQGYNVSNTTEVTWNKHMFIIDGLKIVTLLHFDMLRESSQVQKWDFSCAFSYDISDSPSAQVLFLIREINMMLP